jgi:hypothetical protein
LDKNKNRHLIQEFNSRKVALANIKQDFCETGYLQSLILDFFTYEEYSYSIGIDKLISNALSFINLLSKELVAENQEFICDLEVERAFYFIHENTMQHFVLWSEEVGDFLIQLLFDSFATDKTVTLKKY